MSRIEIVKEGITNLNTESIVNAANEGLREGSGVCGVIFKEAGSKKLTKVCEEIGYCKTGNSVITPGFDLESKYIIHAVGPRYIDGNHNESELLYSAYYSSLNLCKEYDIHSIGFPLISTGVFGYPLEEAWDIALKACRDFISNNFSYDILIRFGVPNERNRIIGLEKLRLIF